MIKSKLKDGNVLEMETRIQFIIKRENLDRVKNVLETFCFKNVNWKSYSAYFQKGKDDISYMLSFLFYTKPTVNVKGDTVIYYFGMMFDPFPIPDPYLEPIYYEDLVELMGELTKYLEDTQTTIFDYTNQYHMYTWIIKDKVFKEDELWLPHP